MGKLTDFQTQVYYGCKILNALVWKCFYASIVTKLSISSDFSLKKFERKVFAERTFNDRI